MNRDNVLKEGKMDYKEMEYELKRKKYIELTNILKYILKRILMNYQVVFLKKFVFI